MYSNVFNIYVHSYVAPTLNKLNIIYIYIVLLLNSIFVKIKFGTLHEFARMTRKFVKRSKSFFCFTKMLFSNNTSVSSSR